MTGGSKKLLMTTHKVSAGNAEYVTSKLKTDQRGGGRVTRRVGCGYQDDTQSMLYTMHKMQHTKQYTLHLILDSSVPSGSNI